MKVLPDGSCSSTKVTIYSPNTNCSPQLGQVFSSAPNAKEISCIVSAFLKLFPQVHTIYFFSDIKGGSSRQ